MYVYGVRPWRNSRRSSETDLAAFGRIFYFTPREGLFLMLVYRGWYGVEWPIVFEFVGNVGFPIFVALYVLFRTEPTINRLGDNVRLMTIIIAETQGVSVDEIKRKYGNGR